MKIELEMFLKIAEHFEKAYLRFYENATIKVNEELFYNEINQIIEQMLIYTYKCNKNYNEINLSKIGEYCVIEEKVKGKSYAFQAKKLGLIIN
ncbi:hypothetical protein [Campylobacter canadensis]|uniref:hypothetical protein n=1 Tax=Campylobacter canadensis TaxID=449520 RepID=UPI001CCD6356|nr:hypothetical protein [Campylobacter canadensis]MBZ8002653.1 hypothetical protein [Campylobacter canadensis]